MASIMASIVASPDQPEGSGNVGYELLDSNKVLHIWNEIDDYYFNTSSGVQFTNHYDEYWAHNIFCGGLKYQGEWEYWCNDELPFDWSINTDNSTYFNYTGHRDVTKTVGENEYEVRFALRYALESEDTYLDVQPYVKNIGELDIPVDLGFAWRIKDIQIGNDEEDDWVYIDGTRYNLNESLDLSFTDLDNTEVFFHDDDEWLWLNWSSNLNYKYTIKNKTGQYNAPNTLMINAGTLSMGQEKSTTFGWIDAMCNWNCNYILPTTQQNLEVGETYSHQAKITYSGTCSKAGNIEAQYNDTSDNTWDKITSSTNLSTSDLNPRTWQLCLLEICGPYTWTVKAEEDNQDEGMYLTRDKCQFNGGQIKYATGAYVNITTTAFDTCDYVTISSSTTLTANNDSCFDITADDVVFDCNNYQVFANSKTFYNYSIIAENVDNITIKNCYLKNWTLGIFFNNVTNSIIENTTIFNTTSIKSGDVEAIAINLNNSNFNTIESNITKMFTDSSSEGAQCNSYLYNKLSAIYFLNSNNNIIKNSIFDKINGTYAGDSNPNEGCQPGPVVNGRSLFFHYSDHNIINKSVVTNYDYPLYFYYSENNSMYNTQINNSYYNYDLDLYYSPDTKFHNVILNKSMIDVNYGSTFFNYYYLKINVTNENYNPINGANVEFTDVFETTTNDTTGADGLTSWNDLIEYNETNGGKTYFTNYNVSGNKSGQDANYTMVNLTESMLILLILPDSAVDTCECPDPGVDWDVEASDDCVITEDCDINVQTLAISGTGTFTVLANITAGEVVIDNNCNFYNKINDGNWLMVKLT